MDLDLNEVSVYDADNNNLIFRKAALADADIKVYAELINQCFGIKQLEKDPSIEVFLLEKEGKSIGTTSIQTREDLSLGYIFDVGIIPEYRNQGLGRPLIKKVY